MKDQRKTAIYSRKSKFTGKGESIESQIDMCKSYLKAKFPELKDEDILIFEDEGYSGGNTNRPQFQKMVNEYKQNNISRIVCYRLDRISRSIVDFIKLTEDLEDHHVEFVSISDNYETHTSTGRAMLAMTMVFAQLERETIAERIRDNMMHLAKSGRWLGGTTPTGYKSVETVGSVTVDGKERKAKMLEIVDEEANVVKLIFSKFLECKSLTKTETFMIQHDIVTKQGKSFTRFAIKNILRNPVYLIADEQAWNYFNSLNTVVYAEKELFDGIHGMMVYNKTQHKIGKANVINDINDWIIAVGKHIGLISGSDWVEVQKLLGQNSSKAYRKPKSNVALLSGLLYCGNCGGFMRPKLSQRKNKDGELIYDYLCELKEKSRRAKCNISRPNGNEIDRLVCEEVKKLAENSSDFIKKIKQGIRSINYNNESYQEKLKSIRHSKEKYEKQIKNLVINLSKEDNSATNKYILEEINSLDSKIKSLNEQEQEYMRLESNNTISEDEFEVMAEMLSNTAKTIDDMTVEQKRNALRCIINKVIWDGENAHIYFFGSDDAYIDLSNDENEKAAASGLQTKSSCISEA